MKRIVLIYNPNAGRGTARTSLASVVETLSEKFEEVMVFPTKKRGDATDLAEKYAEQCDMIACSGGDGTLDEVVNGIMRIPEERRPAVCYIPAGSTNDFAHNLALPANHAEDAQLVERGTAFSCDLGRFNDHFFTYVAGFGLFTSISYETDQQLKNVIGYAAYILEGIKSLANIKAYHMSFEYDGGTVEGDFILGLICNTFSVAGIRGIMGNNVELNDGVFEVLLVRQPENPLDLEFIMEALGTEDVSLQYVVSFKTRSMKIHSGDQAPWTLDGEFGGAPEEVSFSVVPRALKILVPRSEMKILEGRSEHAGLQDAQARTGERDGE